MSIGIKIGRYRRIKGSARRGSLHAPVSPRFGGHRVLGIRGCEARSQRGSGLWVFSVFWWVREVWF